MVHQAPEGRTDRVAHSFEVVGSGGGGGGRENGARRPVARQGRAAGAESGEGQSESRWQLEQIPWMTRLWSVIAKPFSAAILLCRSSMTSSTNSVTRLQRTQTR